jgi:acetyl-CoA carboxylase biotin carboxyl carrier protein
VNVDIAKLKGLLSLLAAEDVAEFEHEAEGVRVRIVRGQIMSPAHLAAHMPHAAAPLQAAAPSTAAATPVDDGSVDVTSPFVGTFYRSPTPDAPAFVENGSVVRPGQALCIIEAMKLMNEIEAEISGTIVECYAQNGKSVEFGQKLFRIKKA